MTAERREWIGLAAQLACIFEVLAEKPGNVTRSKDCAKLTLAQFLVSAAAIGQAFRPEDGARVGDIILCAADATKRLVGVNTNIGIVLLLSPLVLAAAENHPKGLRAALTWVLRSLDIRDARLAFQAILAAAPEGLDRVEKGDVRTAPIDYTLRQAMAMAKDRDSLASEYVTDFAIVFETGLPTLKKLWESGSRLSEALVQTYLTILAKVPDTDIIRKLNREAALHVSGQAANILALDGVFSASGRKAIALFDESLRDNGRRYNPGTTADLVAAVAFAFLVTQAEPEMVPALLERW